LGSKLLQSERERLVLERAGVHDRGIEPIDDEAGARRSAAILRGSQIQRIRVPEWRRQQLQYDHKCAGERAIRRHAHRGARHGPDASKVGSAANASRRVEFSLRFQSLWLASANHVTGWL